MGATGTGSRSAVSTDSAQRPWPSPRRASPRRPSTPRAQGSAGSQRRSRALPPPRQPPRPRSAPNPPRLGPQTAPGGGANGREEGGSGLGAHRDFPRRAWPDKDQRPQRRWRMLPRPWAAAAGSRQPGALQVGARPLGRRGNLGRVCGRRVGKGQAALPQGAPTGRPGDGARRAWAKVGQLLAAAGPQSPANTLRGRGRAAAPTPPRLRGSRGQ